MLKWLNLKWLCFGIRTPDYSIYIVCCPGFARHDNNWEDIWHGFRMVLYKSGTAGVWIHNNLLSGLLVRLRPPISPIRTLGKYHFEHMHVPSFHRVNDLCFLQSAIVNFIRYPSDEAHSTPHVLFLCYFPPSTRTSWHCVAARYWWVCQALPGTFPRHLLIWRISRNWTANGFKIPWVGQTGVEIWMGKFFNFMCWH